MNLIQKYKKLHEGHMIFKLVFLGKDMLHLGDTFYNTINDHYIEIVINIKNDYVRSLIGL